MVDRIGFRLVTPPGWVSIALDDPSPQPVRDVAKRIAGASAPSARPQVEKLVFEQLSQTVADASTNGGLELLLPLEPIDGLALPVSIVIAASPILPGATASSQSEALLAFAGAQEHAEAREVGGALAVRAVSDVTAVPGTVDLLRVFDTRRVAYVIAPPIATRQLFIATGSIRRFDYDTTGEILAAMELLFDAIVATIRFEYTIENDSTDNSNAEVSA
jgi:hypothetical protein